MKRFHGKKQNWAISDHP